VISVARHPAFVAHAPGFAEVTGDDRAPSLLAVVDAHEGPVHFADENALYFTTLPRPGVDRTLSVEIKRLPLDEPGDVSVPMGGANGANGMTADRAGRLIVCEQGSRGRRRASALPTGPRLIANRLSRTGEDFPSTHPAT
jgi:sugar lactone lactonase YvrE